MDPISPVSPIDPTPASAAPTPERRSRHRRRRARTRRRVLGGLVALAVLAAPIAYFATTRGTDDTVQTDPEEGPTTPLAAVRAAIGQTSAAGSFEIDQTTTSIATRPGMPGSPPMTTVIEGHATVNVEPYAMATKVVGGNFTGATSYVNATHIWVNTSSTNAYARGTPLSDFASTIMGALGNGPGAVAVLTLANRGGNLNLQEEAVASAAPSGTGEVGGIPVTYYDVTIDLKELARADGMSSVQRQAISNAIVALDRSGYEGTSERIGIDDLGYVREVTSSTRFADGSSSERYMVITNIGCAPRVSLPDGTGGAEDVTGVCVEDRPTATTTPPTTTPPQTAAPTTTTTTPSTTSTVPATTPTTAPPTPTTGSPPTTPSPPPTT